MAPSSSDAPQTHRLRTRLTLVESLKRHDPAGWKEFSCIYGKLIHGFARKSGCSHEEAQEVVQETLISVAKEIVVFDTDRSKAARF